MDENTASHPQNSGDEKKKRKRLKKLQSEIRQQIEFYFSDANLRKDRFLRQEMDKTQDGYIHISTVASFNRIRKMTGDQALIAKAMEKSDLIELSEDKTMIRRKTPLEELKYNLDDVIVYVENLPHNVDHDMMKKTFSTCGNVAYVSLPRYKTSGDPKRFAFVEFSNPMEAAKACKLLNNPPKRTLHNEGHFPLTRKGRLILPEQPTPRELLPEERRHHSTKRSDEKENITKRKREASETEEPPLPEDESDKSDRKKKKPSTEKSESASDGHKKVKSSSKVQLGESKTTDEGEQVDAKRKKDTSSIDKRDRERDGQSERTSRKRRHSEGDDGSHGRSSHSEVRSHKGERSHAGGKDEKSSRDRAKEEASGTHKRKRDDSTGSLEGSKAKRSSSSIHKDRKEEGRVAKRRLEDSEETEEAEDGNKKKRKSRSRKHKKEEVEPAVMSQLRVMPKKEWLVLKEEYLAIQKASRQRMKQDWKAQYQTDRSKSEPNQKKEPQAQPQVDEAAAAAAATAKSTEPLFVPGTVLRISSEKPFASRVDLREQLQGISPVAYIDMTDGDTTGFVRLKSAEGAMAVLGKASQVANASGPVQMNLLSGQDEEQYWEKLRSQRLTKLQSNKRKPKKRGVVRILDKSEKVLGSGAKKSHIIFDD